MEGSLRDLWIGSLDRNSWQDLCVGSPREASTSSLFRSVKSVLYQMSRHETLAGPAQDLLSGSLHAGPEQDICGGSLQDLWVGTLFTLYKCSVQDL